MSGRFDGRARVTAPPIASAYAHGMVVAQWVVAVAAIALGVLWVPGLVLLWACPVIAVVGGRSAFGAPVHAPVRFLGGRISMLCWVIGAVGLFDLIR